MKQMSGNHVHYDVHILDPTLGHIWSEDCWCEPSRAYWVLGQDNRYIHVLEHNDKLDPNSTWANHILNDLR
jgi:hypothetical protein